MAVKRVLPIPMAFELDIRGKSSSFRLVAPDAESRRSSNLPGKAPKVRTQLSLHKTDTCELEFLGCKACGPVAR